MYKKNLGVLGENIAATWLLEKNHHILKRNFRIKFGEADIISVHHSTLVITEVKTRTSSYFGEPFEAVNRTKINHISKAGKAFASMHHLQHLPMQIDIISILLNNFNRVIKFQHFENITSMSTDTI